MSKLRSGDWLGVRGPYGTSWPVEEARGKDVVLVAGGIGLAPLRPVLYYLLNHRREYGRIVLQYGARTPADLLFRKELERWRGRFDMQVRATVDRADGDWLGNVGVVTQLIAGAHFEPEQALAMVCGPEVMMRFTVIELEKSGLDLSQIYVSMERNMKCGIGLCGHCQFGQEIICRDGPVFPFPQVETCINRREV
jgi:NAD(P)H-flavin reductase